MSGTSIPEKRQGGLQVVKASQEPGLRWDLDEAALASVLLRPDIRNLPVVVVSVAGVYRGGKSFILGFFLRYLMASKEHQLNGQWLGKDDDLLEDGFNWRVGSDPDTKGIYLWPEPIVINIERTGRKVAVLLMDTQGTFDTNSDMGDNSSIFALSVLLSSTQIYNLRANIREDDLQHLQLFTEYGKLATKLDGKAFQTLLFLIRNWQDPDDYSYGYIGGKALLDKKLAPKPNQKAQLLEVRKHIHSCFEKLECFLMPYPGNCVTSKKFKGRLGDIDKDFKSALLDLVPALFNRNNLNPKTINGEETQAQGLFVYFKQYAAIFNSNELPPASTIFQATAEAAMSTALREACQYYEGIMKNKIIKDQSVLTSMIQTWHNTALEAAIAHFNGKKKFSSKKKQIADNLAELKKTSENWLLVYQLQNNEKLRNALSEAQKVYENTVAVVCQDQAFICLHVLDLEALHNTALMAALNSFDPTREAVPMEQDTDRNDFINKLEENYQRLCVMNKRNNSNAVLDASRKYLQNMSGTSKKEDHEESLKIAIQHFLSQRNQLSEETEDDDLDHLQQEIEGYYKEFNRKNGQKNLLAMNAAECAYKNYVNSEIGSKSCCFHPLALKKLHDVARDRALEQFQNSRIETEQDNYEDRLIANIEDQYRDLEKLNRLNNIDAVDKAYNEYKRIMEKYLEFSYWDLLGEPYLRKKLGTTNQHNTARDEALNLFNGKRREHCYVDDDDHLRLLKQKIDEVYITHYESLFGAIGRVAEEAATKLAGMVKQAGDILMDYMKK